MYNYRFIQQTKHMHQHFERCGGLTFADCQLPTQLLSVLLLNRMWEKIR